MVRHPHCLLPCPFLRSCTCVRKVLLIQVFVPNRGNILTPIERSTLMYSEMVDGGFSCSCFSIDIIRLLLLCSQRSSLLCISNLATEDIDALGCPSPRFKVFRLIRHVTKGNFQNFRIRDLEFRHLPPVNLLCRFFISGWNHDHIANKEGCILCTKA